jgi:hypothetical protein
LFLVGYFVFLYSDKAGILTIEIQTGVKPVSVFGLVHQICEHTVVTNLHRDFPGLKEETFPADTNVKGWGAFIKDYIVDIGILDKIDVHGGTSGSHAEHGDTDGPDTPGWVQNDIV